MHDIQGHLLPMYTLTHKHLQAHNWLPHPWIQADHMACFGQCSNRTMTQRPKSWMLPRAGLPLCCPWGSLKRHSARRWEWGGSTFRFPLWSLLDLDNQQAQCDRLIANTWVRQVGMGLSVRTSMANITKEGNQEVPHGCCFQQLILDVTYMSRADPNRMGQEKIFFYFWSENSGNVLQPPIKSKCRDNIIMNYEFNYDYEFTS